MSRDELLEDHAVELVDGFFDSAFGELLTGRNVMLALEEEACWRKAVAEVTAMAEQRAREEVRLHGEALQLRLAEQRRRAAEALAHAKAAEARRRRAEDDLQCATVARIAEDKKANAEMQKKLHEGDSNEIAVLRAENDKLRAQLLEAQTSKVHVHSQSEAASDTQPEAATTQTTQTAGPEVAVESLPCVVEEPLASRAVCGQLLRGVKEEVYRNAARYEERAEAKKLASQVLKLAMRRCADVASATLNST